MEYSKLNIYGTELEHLFTSSCGTSVSDDLEEVCLFCKGELFRGMKDSPAYVSFYGEYSDGAYYDGEGIICKKCGHVADILQNSDEEGTIFLKMKPAPAPYELYLDDNDEAVLQALYKALMGNDIELKQRLLKAMSDEYTDQFYLKSIIMFCQLTWDPLNIGKEDYLDAT